MDLQKWHTKELLWLLNSTRACGGSYDISDGCSDYVTYSEVKEELSYREHIPNKTEARIIRQNKAKRKQ